MIPESIKECIILAGGLGTRLRSVVTDVPKCMAVVAGKPFLDHVIRYLLDQGIESFIFSLGYKHEVIEDYIRAKYPDLHVQYSIEEFPLGTGGAILLASSKLSVKNVLIINGDTFFRVNIKKLSLFHLQNNADCTIALKPLKNFDRYGVVELNTKGYIISFREKKFYGEGLINGGIYILNSKLILSIPLPSKFSFEKDYLEKYYSTHKMMGLVQDEYFIDIGIPEDLLRADKELSFHIHNS